MFSTNSSLDLRQSEYFPRCFSFIYALRIQVHCVTTSNSWCSKAMPVCSGFRLGSDWDQFSLDLTLGNLEGLSLFELYTHDTCAPHTHTHSTSSCQQGHYLQYNELYKRLQCRGQHFATNALLSCFMLYNLRGFAI